MDNSLPRFHLDQPKDWNRWPRCLIMRGWCFGADGKSIRGIRLRANAVKLDGVIGLPRPDVKAAMTDAPDNATGFEIRGTLPSGRVALVLEVLPAVGDWQPLLSRGVEVERQLIPFWLGGGAWTDLMFFQMPAHMAHPPRPVRVEKFPLAPARPGWPKISVVTPSFQQGRYLDETMRSVLEQPGVTCQYVVQDGGSTDHSRAVIEGHAKRLHAWTCERDGGQADAIARGFARTTGGPDDIMAWINSDDCYQPGALAFVAEYFFRHPEVDAVYGHRIVVDEASQEIARWFLPPHDADVLRLNDFVPQETLFWRRRIWDNVGGLDTSFKFAMDWDLLLRFTAAGARIVRLPYFIACFRVHPTQKTSFSMHDTGQKEITLLRERSQGRTFPIHELETSPVLLRYLRRSAWIQFLWKLGVRAS